MKSEHNRVKERPPARSRRMRTPRWQTPRRGRLDGSGEALLSRAHARGSVLVSPSQAEGLPLSRNANQPPEQ